MLQKSVSRPAGRNRLALLWLLGLLALLLGLVAMLLLYLNNFEQEEAARRRAADAQWLEQSVQFHFRRLEDDLLVLARQVVLQGADAQAGASAAPALQGGMLWREPGVLLAVSATGNEPRVPQKITFFMIPIPCRRHRR